MKMKLMDFNKFLRLKCIFFSGPKLIIRPISRPQNQVQKLGSEIRLIRRKIRYICIWWFAISSVWFLVTHYSSLRSNNLVIYFAWSFVW